MTPGDALYLGFEENLAGNAIRLQIAASIEGIGVDPTDPPLAWEAWSREAWIPIPVHSDTTGGLNRNGEVVLLLPLGLLSLSIGGTRAFWLRARLAQTHAGQTPYQASPRIGSVAADTLGGTVPAEHAVAEGRESLGRSDASPGQSFIVSRPPVLPRRADERVRLITASGPEDWDEVADFTASEPADRHYTWDGATGTIRFGPSVRYPDGSVRQHGAIPADGAEIVVSGYRHGGGATGNVGAETLTVLRSTVAFIDRVSNIAPATGGVDAETVRNAKLRGPITLRTGQRAVTAVDFERLTLESSAEVARARCLPPREPGHPIRLLVVPDVLRPPEAHRLDDFALSDPLVARISGHLEQRRTLGTTVEITTPYYQGVTVAALIQSLPGRPAGLVRQRALDLLYRYVNPLVGGPLGEGWPFERDLNAAPLAQMLEAVEGVERVDEVLLFEYDLRNGARYGTGRDSDQPEVWATGAQRQRLVGPRREGRDEAGPQQPRGPELRHLGEEVHADREEERQPRGEVVDLQPGREPGPDVVDAVRQRIGELEVGRRPGLLHVVAGDRDRVEASACASTCRRRCRTMMRIEGSGG